MKNTKKSFNTILAENFDFSDLNVEEQIQAEKDIKELLMENTLIRVIEESSEEEGLAFEKFLEGGKQSKEIMTYLESNLPIFNKILFEEVKELSKTN